MSRLTKFSQLLRSKKELISCIFITLIIQICVSIATMKWDQTHHILEKRNSVGYFIALLLLMFLLIYGMIAPKISFYTRQILFGLFSIIVGLLLSQTIHIINNPAIVEAAAIATLVNFGVMLLLGLIIVYLKYDLEWMGIFLLIGLLCLIVGRIFAYFSKDSKEINRNISMIAVVIFSLYILYDTNNILLKYKNNDKRDCILGALDYYLDIWNLFSEYLDIKS